MVTRKIVFYRWADVNPQPPFVPSEVALKLAAQIDESDVNAVLEQDDTTTVVEPVRPGDESKATYFKLLALRNPGNRPVQWELGNGVTSLQLLDDQYPADLTHVAIWPDGIAAQDFTRDSPRLGRLAFFLRRRTHAYVSFDPLYRPDMYDRLRMMAGKLRSVHLVMTRPTYLENDRGTFGELVPAVWGHKAPSINVQIGVGRFGPRDRYLDQEIEEKVFEIADNASELVDRFIVRGVNPETGKVDQVSLLNERLQVDAVLKPSSEVPEVPDSEATFKKMESAFKDMESQGLFKTAVRAQLMRKK